MKKRTLERRQAVSQAYEGPKSICTCGHEGDGKAGAHSEPVGGGACTVEGCACLRFTWAGYLPAFEAAVHHGIGVALSKDATTKTTTRDDGAFTRTAIVMGADGKTGSLDVVDASGAFLARVNLIWTPTTELDRDGSEGRAALIVDVIDEARRFTHHRALGFAKGQPHVEMSVPPGGRMVSVDFRK